VHLQSQDSDKDVKMALKIIPTRLSLADCERELMAIIEFAKPKVRIVELSVLLLFEFSANCSIV
jgi:hypothetical protein